MKKSALLAVLLMSLMPFKAGAVSEGELLLRAPQIVAHYESGSDGQFAASDGTKLDFHINLARSETAAVVLVNGRGESHLKYAELIYDLNQLGYSVYTYDHRGQGLSQGRRTDYPDRDWVAHFDTMAADLNVFASTVVPARARLYLLAHSMGGLVAARFAELYPHTARRFRALALNSPAMGLQTGYPDVIAEPLTCLFLKGSDYAPGETDYDVGADLFEGNGVTSSRARFEFQKERMLSVPGVPIGGVTNRWVCETIKAGHAALRDAPYIGVPILVTSAQNDTLVRPLDEQFFCAWNRHCRFKSYGGQHELLMEADPIRSRVLADILDFFKKR